MGSVASKVREELKAKPVPESAIQSPYGFSNHADPAPMRTEEAKRSGKHSNGAAAYVYSDYKMTLDLGLIDRYRSAGSHDGKKAASARSSFDSDE